MWLQFLFHLQFSKKNGHTSSTLWQQPPKVAWLAPVDMLIAVVSTTININCNSITMTIMIIFPASKRLNGAFQRRRRSFWGDLSRYVTTRAREWAIKFSGFCTFTNCTWAWPYQKLAHPVEIHHVDHFSSNWSTVKPRLWLRILVYRSNEIRTNLQVLSVLLATSCHRRMCRTGCEEKTSI